MSSSIFRVFSAVCLIIGLLMIGIPIVVQEEVNLLMVGFWLASSMIMAAAVKMTTPREEFFTFIFKDDYNKTITVVQARTEGEAWELSGYSMDETMTERYVTVSWILTTVPSANLYSHEVERLVAKYDGPYEKRKHQY